jgi:hypothetical protein
MAYRVATSQSAVAEAAADDPVVPTGAPRRVVGRAPWLAIALGLLLAAILGQTGRWVHRSTHNR